MRALCDGRSSELCRTHCIACHSVLQKETKEEAQRHHDVTHRVEDDRPLRISKPLYKEYQSCVCNVIFIIIEINF